MEENEKINNITELAKSFSEMSRNAGKVTFKVTYTATPGNIKIYEAFQRYAFDEANNEYLAAISKLMDNASFIYLFRELDARLSAVEKSVFDKAESPKKEESKVKTF